MFACYLNLIEFQNREEGFLRHFDVTDLLHAFLSALLLLEQLTLTTHVATVTFCQHILANLLNGLACNDLRANRGLNSYIELLTQQ